MSATFWNMRRRKAAESAPKQEKAKDKASAKKGGGKSGK